MATGFWLILCSIPLLALFVYLTVRVIRTIDPSL